TRSGSAKSRLRPPGVRLSSRSTKGEAVISRANYTTSARHTEHSPYSTESNQNEWSCPALCRASTISRTTKTWMAGTSPAMTEFYAGTENAHDQISSDDQHLALAERGLVAHQAPRSRPEADGAARLAQPMLHEPEIVELHHAAVAEGGKQLLGLLEQNEAAAPQPKAREPPDAVLDDDGAGHHAPAEIIARVAADDNEPAAHALAEQRSGIAADAQEPTPHAERLADKNAGRPLAGIAVNRDLSARHARAGKGSGASLDRDLAALHAGAEIGAHVALDENLAVLHRGPNLVAARVGAGEGDRAAPLASHLEQIADFELVARGSHDKRLDLLALERLELGGDERRQVEPLIGLCLELETERAHQMRSLRWK